MAQTPSHAFDLLNKDLQQWIWQRNWTELRDAQEIAIPVILKADTDVIISATTASGKTEAALLPIASSLADAAGKGLALYISPLKALINDQNERLQGMFNVCDLPVHPWHGDVLRSKKSGFERDPHGVLLITPESLEGIFVRKGFDVPTIFQGLRFVVVDELHSFINTERGMQLCSLLHRLELALKRRVPRIGLSATLGDMSIAAEFLRPGESKAVTLIESRAEGQEIRVLVKGYLEVKLAEADGGPQQAETLAVENTGLAGVRIARDLMKVMKGSKNLIFANSRRSVEEFTDRLSRICEADRIANEFFAHHGSLSKDLREEVETILKESGRPATAICTSSLEMGIDIGAVKSVAQLDPPFSVASLRQRLGRSGRRGEPAILRMFVTEPELGHQSLLQDSLRLDLFQGVAAIELLLKRWCEPPASARLHLSTLVQQVLSTIAERGGATAAEVWGNLCRTGPFRNVDQAMFALLLRELAKHDLIMQSPDGTLLHGQKGEQIVNHYTFYAAFWTSEEFRVLHESKLLGSLPVSHPIPVKSLILFGGRRWRVEAVDDRSRTVEVTPAQGGRAPRFAGTGGVVHRNIHQEMLALYRKLDTPMYLDAEAKDLFIQGRRSFQKNGLESRRLVRTEVGTLVFLWAGDLVANTLLVQLQPLGFEAISHGVAIHVEGIEPEKLKAVLTEIVASGPTDAVVLSDAVPNKINDRYDCYLPLNLLSENYASGMLDTTGTWQALRTIVGDGVTPGSQVPS